MGPELGDGSFCSGRKISFFFFFFVLEVDESSTVCAFHIPTPCTTVPEARGWQNTNNNMTKLVWGLVWRFFVFL